MSTELTKDLVRRFYSEMFQNAAVIEECIDPTYIDHNNERAGRGPEVVRTHIAGLLQTFPDFCMQIEAMLAEGDHVMTRITGRGTHTGVWMQIKPTGALVNV